MSLPPLTNLQVDPKRKELHGSTGIYVRAKVPGESKYDSFDIAASWNRRHFSLGYAAEAGKTNGPRTP